MASCLAAATADVDGVQPAANGNFVAKSKAALFPATVWKPCETGPWGDLEAKRVIWDLPESLFPSSLLTAEPARWYLPAASVELAQEILARGGLARTQQEYLTDPARCRANRTGTLMSPSDQYILSLDGSVRAKLYALLGQADRNTLHYQPYVFRPDELSARLQQARLSAKTVATIQRLTYRRGEYLLFSDKNVLLRSIQDTAERRRAVQMLVQFPIYHLRLRLGGHADIKRIAQYWGGTRNPQLEPMLRSLLQREPQATYVDVSLLLPPFARERLNEHPIRSLPQAFAGPNCFWTAANFFREKPDVVFLNQHIFWANLQKNCAPVARQPQFGDVAIFVNSQDSKPCHVAIYLAADILFTKNGYHCWDPWILNSLEDLKALYASQGTVEVRYFRQQQAADEPSAK